MIPLSGLIRCAVKRLIKMNLCSRLTTGTTNLASVHGITSPTARLHDPVGINNVNRLQNPRKALSASGEMPIDTIFCQEWCVKVNPPLSFVAAELCEFFRDSNNSTNKYTKGGVIWQVKLFGGEANRGRWCEHWPSRASNAD